MERAPAFAILQFAVYQLCSLTVMSLYVCISTSQMCNSGWPGGSCNSKNNCSRLPRRSLCRCLFNSYLYTKSFFCALWCAKLLMVALAGTLRHVRNLRIFTFWAIFYRMKRCGQSRWAFSPPTVIMPIRGHDSIADGCTSRDRDRLIVIPTAPGRIS